MGNPRVNALPSCQLVELARLLAALPPYDADDKAPTSSFQAWLDHVSLQCPAAPNPERSHHPQYFWMDTLCVPVSPSNIRKQAIISMRSIYSNASRVLILDAELRSSTSAASPEEKLSRIACSAWVRRLWTLQEGVLAPKLYFQFAEAPFLFDVYAYPDFEEKLYDNPVSQMAQESDLTRTAWAVPSLLRAVRTFQALKSRATSREGDQPICIATLLDVDLAELLSAPETDRVRKLWSLFRQVPAATLFLPGQKLDDPVYGWAPAHCMDCRHLAMPIDIPADVTSHGVRVSLPGFILEPPGEAVGEVMAVTLQDATFYVRRNMKYDGASWDGLDLHLIPRLAVLLPQSPWKGGRLGLVASIAVLVSVVSEGGDEWSVEYLRFVSVIRKGCRYDLGPNPPWSKREGIEKGRIGKGMLMEGDRKWIVSGRA